MQNIFRTKSLIQEINILIINKKISSENNAWAHKNALNSLKLVCDGKLHDSVCIGSGGVEWVVY